jgi:hypothetical protein
MVKLTNQNICYGKKIMQKLILVKLSMNEIIMAKI